MTVEELIKELKAFPLDYEVKLRVYTGDWSAESEEAPLDCLSEDKYDFKTVVLSS